jgi:hypothetical protein
MSAVDWRALLSRAPLPMLALAASHGVYSYNLLFVPPWVALVSAAAFELTYCGLAVVRLSAGQRRRAQRIATSAVAVSIFYNTLAGLFHRRPELLTALPVGLDIVLSVLHGMPLAIVAYSVAHLLLHEPPAPTTIDVDQPAVPAEPVIAETPQPVPAGCDAVSTPYQSAVDSLPATHQPLDSAEQGYDGGVVSNLAPDTWRGDAAPASEMVGSTQPIIDGSTLLTHRCPRCGAPINQAQYAAAVRRGSAWRGCAQCREHSTDTTTPRTA